MSATDPTAGEHRRVSNGSDSLDTCTGCDWESWDTAPSFAAHIAPPTRSQMTLPTQGDDMGETTTDPRDVPRIFIQRTGLRGHMAWQAWLKVGVVRYEREWGTYAWTEEGARRKGQRLLDHWTRRTGHPAIEVDA